MKTSWSLSKSICAPCDTKSICRLRTGGLIGRCVFEQRGTCASDADGGTFRLKYITSGTHTEARNIDTSMICAFFAAIATPRRMPTVTLFRWLLGGQKANVSLRLYPNNFRTWL